MDGDDGVGDDESTLSSLSSLASRSLASRSLASRLETETRSIASRSLESRSIASRSVSSMSTVRAFNRQRRSRLRWRNNNNNTSSSDDGRISWSFLNEHRNLVIILLATYVIHSQKHQIHNLFTTRQRQYKYKTINTKELTETYHYKSVSDASFDATKPPQGYPFHRWSTSASSGSSSQQQLSGYPLHVDKFVSILRHMGKGDRIKVPFEHGLKALSAKEEFVRLSGSSYPYLVQNGKVLRPFGKMNRWKRYKWHSQGHHIDWVTLLESAVSMAKILEEKNPRMQLITQSEFPIIFDEFDYAWCGDDQVPIFRLSRNEEDCSYSWPSLSQEYILPQRKQWLKDTPIDWDLQFAQWSTQYPWTSKKPMAVWRGRYTGHRDLYNQGVLPREVLVIRASSYPHLMDVQPVSWNYYPESQTGKVMEQSNDAIPFQEFMKYRAIINIEGSGITRFGPALCTNSVVIQVKPRSGSYWSHELEPWTHYIPVKEDLSDLKHSVEFAVQQKNSAQVQGIIKNANAWCRRKMVWETHVLDFLWTLLDYAELLDKAPRFHERWKNDKDAYNLPSLEMAEFDGELLI
eukprot:scaffold5677_cov153-Skeletonema_menzelii.AAC.8